MFSQLLIIIPISQSILAWGTPCWHPQVSSARHIQSYTFVVFCCSFFIVLLSQHLPAAKEDLHCIQPLPANSWFPRAYTSKNVALQMVKLTCFLKIPENCDQEANNTKLTLHIHIIELDWILIGPFQLGLFCDSVTF